MVHTSRGAEPITTIIRCRAGDAIPGNDVWKVLPHDVHVGILRQLPTAPESIARVVDVLEMGPRPSEAVFDRITTPGPGQALARRADAVVAPAPVTA